MSYHHVNQTPEQKVFKVSKHHLDRIRKHLDRLRSENDASYAHFQEKYARRPFLGLASDDEIELL